MIKDFCIKISLAILFMREDDIMQERKLYVLGDNDLINGDIR